MTSLLVTAASKGDQLLMERTLGGEYGEYTKEDIIDALLRAACLGNASCVSRLLAHGADPDCEDLDGDTPLMLAAANGHIDVVKLLLASGCDVDLQSERNRTALHMAVWAQKFKVVRVLLDANCELDLKDRYGDTPLMLSARKGHLDIMQLLLSRGCDVTKTNHDSESVMHYASKCGNRDCVRLLLKYGPDVEARTAWGFTPLMIAAMNGRTEAAMILIKAAGANVNATDRAQKTALHYAVKRNLATLTEALLEHGSSVDSTDADGNTALFDALAAGKMSLVRVLVRYGCGVHWTARATVGQQLRWCTPLELAISRRDLPASKLLFACGSKLNEFFLPVEHLDTIDGEMGEWIVDVRTNPVSLSDSVRICIRDILGTGLLMKTRLLPLPSALQNFLSYSDSSEFL